MVVVGVSVASPSGVRLATTTVREWVTMTEGAGPFAPFAEGCDADDCDAPTPWDMSAVLFDHRRGFCSPDCALAYLNDHDDIPATVKLHDPQYHVDRADLGVPSECVDLVRDVDGYGAVVEAVEDMDGLHGGPWRVAVE